MKKYLLTGPNARQPGDWGIVLISSRPPRPFRGKHANATRVLEVVPAKSKRR